MLLILSPSPTVLSRVNVQIGGDMHDEKVGAYFHLDWLSLEILRELPSLWHDTLSGLLWLF